MPTQHKADIAVIGGGPAGYVAAIRAAQLGFRAVCVEADDLGGVCLNWGCIPTKALLHNAHLFHTLQHKKDELGFEFTDLRFNLGRVVERSRKVASRLSRGVDSLFRKYKVEHLAARAVLRRPGVIGLLGAENQAVGELSARYTVLATGARPRPLPLAPFDGHKVLSYKEAMVPERMPARLTIVGAGAIGVEFAYFYRAFGCEVNLVELQERLLPVEDEESSATVLKSFLRMGISVYAGWRTAAIDTLSDGVALTIEREGKSEVLLSDQVLVAVGVQANSAGLGLEECGVALERGFVQVDKSYRTCVEGIYAIGDLVGPPWLAHVAMAEALCCVERIAGHTRPDVPYHAIPGCTYCQPEVASVGLTEQALVASGTRYRVGRFPLSANGKALGQMEETGYAKVLIGEPHGEILGAHMVGHGATEMIHETVLARTAELRAADLLHMVHAHPTVSESVHEAIALALGEAVHL